MGYMGVNLGDLFRVTTSGYNGSVGLRACKLKGSMPKMLISSCSQWLSLTVSGAF